MTRKELCALYERHLEKKTLDQEIFRKIFQEQADRPAFQNMEQAGTICRMRLGGAKYDDIAEATGLSKSYCSTVVRKVMHVYRRRMENEKYRRLDDCVPSNLEHLIAMSKCAADGHPEGMRKFAEALLTLPEDLKDFTRSEQIYVLVQWLDMECTEDTGKS